MYNVLHFVYQFLVTFVNKGPRNILGGPIRDT